MFLKHSDNKMLRIFTYLTAFAGVNPIMKTTRLIATNSTQNCITIKFCNDNNISHLREVSKEVSNVWCCLQNNVHDTMWCVTWLVLPTSKNLGTPPKILQHRIQVLNHNSKPARGIVLLGNFFQWSNQNCRLFECHCQNRMQWELRSTNTVELQ